MIHSDKLDELRILAEEMAVSAGKLARQLWSKPRQISHKGFRDLVTDADFAAQHLITDAIQAQFPNHGFLTEEEDSRLPESGPFIWIVDPIDGTTNYSRQIPEFCISIAACLPHDGGFTPVAAAIYDPMRQELFSAAQGQGATLQIGAEPRRTLQVSSVADPAEAVLCLDWSSSNTTRASILELLNQLAQKSFTVRAIGTAVLAMAWVAAGRVDAYLNLRLRPWDVAGALLLVQESGGAFTTPEGKPINWDVAGMDCLVSNGRIQLDLPHSSDNNLGNLSSKKRPFLDTKLSCQCLRLEYNPVMRWPPYKHVFFDCDSTLSTVEGIDVLAETTGKKWRVEVLTNAAMDGKLDLEDVYAKRLQAVRPTHEQIQKIRSVYKRNIVQMPRLSLPRCNFWGIRFILSAVVWPNRLKNLVFI